MRAANDLGVSFKIIEDYGVITLGRHVFVRLRTDARALPEVTHALGGGRILPGPDGQYWVTLGGRKGKVNGAMMQASTANPVKYRGVGESFWERQFPVVDTP